MKIFRLIEMRGSASKGFALLLMLIFVREARAQRCPTLSGRNKTICFNAALEDNAFNNLEITDANAVGGTYAYRPRLVRNNGIGRRACKALSAPATVTVLQFEIGDPSDVSVCSGENTTFTCVIDNQGGASPVLQWQVNKAGAWINDDTGTPESRAALTLQLQDIPAAYNGYQYRLQASNGICTKNSAPASLAVSPKPVFTKDLPLTRTACERDTLSLRARGNGIGQITYQWKRKAPGAGAFADVGSAQTEETARWDIPSDEVSMSNMNGAVYQVTITDDNCSAQSAEMTLTLKTLPTISRHPESVSVCEGDAANFSVTASGIEPLVYQWVMVVGNATNVGANAPSYATPPTTPADFDGNRYYVKITDGNNCPALSSNRATLTVNTKPRVTASPAERGVCQGSNALFTATRESAAAPVGTPAYQWEQDPATGAFAPLSSNASANSAELLLTAVTAGMNNYRYRAKLVDGACTVYSDPVVLTILALPVFAENLAATAVICGGVRHTVSVRATYNNPASTSPILYEWFEDRGNTGTFIAVGSNSSQYAAQRDYDWDNNANNTILVKVKVNCLMWSNTMRVTVQAPPRITLQPTSAEACSGMSIVFTAAAESGANNLVSYQWQEDPDNDGIFTPINPAVNTAALTIDNPLVSNRYQVLVSNHERCAAYTDIATMTVLPSPVFPNTPPIPNQAVACIDGGFGYDGTASPSSGTGAISYQWKILNTETNAYDNIVGQTNSVYQLSSLPVSMNGNRYKVAATLGRCTRESNISSLLVSADLPIDTHPQNLSICRGDNAVFAVSINAQSPSYQWQQDPNTGVFANIAGQTSATLTLLAPAAEGYKYRVVINVGNCTVTSNLAELTLAHNAPVVGALVASPEVCRGVAYRFVSDSESAEGTLKYQWKQAALTGDFSNLGEETADNFLRVAAPQTSMRYRVVVRIDGSSCQRESAAATLTVNPLPTTTAPQDASACPGDNVAFTVTAGAGTEPYSYQWKQNSANTGTNSDRLDLPNIQSADNGKTYAVTVTDSKLCTVTSPAARLIIGAASAITRQPVPQTICSDKPATFSVGVQPGYSIQWQEAESEGEFADIAGAILDTYTLTNAAGKNRHRYQTVISGGGAACNGLSNEVMLTVNEAPAITSFAQTSGTICEGENVSYTVVASGTPLNYQWLQDQNSGAFVAVGTDATAYGITAAVPSQTGYKTTVRVTHANNNCFVTADPPFTLTVNPRPDAAAEAVPQVICSGGITNIVLRNPNGVAGTAYQWTVAAPAAVTRWAEQTAPTAGPIAQTLSSSSAAGETVTYRVTPTANNCAGAAVLAAVRVNPVPDAFADVTTAVICSGGSISITLSNPNRVGGTTFKWTTDAPETVTGWRNENTGASLIAQSLLSSAASTQRVTYSIVPTAEGCDGQPITAVIEVQSLVQIGSQPQSVLLCPGQEMRLYADAEGTPPLAYQWKRNGADIEGAVSAVYQMAVDEPDHGSRFAVSVTNPCETRLSSETVLRASVEEVFRNASATPSVSAADYLQPITFTYEGPIFTFDWDFGDGTEHSDFRTPTHNYTAAGPYTVVLKVRHGEKCARDFTIPLTVVGEEVNPPTGDIRKQSDVVCYPVPLQETLRIASEKRMTAVSLFTLTGSEIWSRPVGAKETKADVSGLPSGIYILRVETEEGARQFKVVK